jgi:hypothetical protein
MPDLRRAITEDKGITTASQGEHELREEKEVLEARWRH